MPSQILRIRTILSHRSSLSADQIEDACLDFDLAAMDQLHWVERRKQETEEADAPPRNKNARPKIQVPVYKTLEEVLALDIDGIEDSQESQGKRLTLTRKEIEDQAKTLMRDPDAYAAFLGKQ